MASSACNLATFSPVETLRPLKNDPRAPSEREYHSALPPAATGSPPPSQGRGAGGLGLSPRELLDRPVHVPLGFPRRQRLALVPQLLAAGQSHLDLHAPPPVIHPQRHQRDAAFVYFPREVRDLVAVQQQLARTHRFVIA